MIGCDESKNSVWKRSCSKDCVGNFLNAWKVRRKVERPTYVCRIRSGLTKRASPEVPGRAGAPYLVDRLGRIGRVAEYHCNRTSSPGYISRFDNYSCQSPEGERELRFEHCQRERV